MQLQDAKELLKNLGESLDFLENIFPPPTTLEDMGHYWNNLKTKIEDNNDPQYLTDGQKEI
jgi:hypothetical protein